MEHDPLPGLLFAGAGLDRAAHRRDEAGLLDSLLSDPATRVVVVRADRVLVTQADTGKTTALALGRRAPQPSDAGRLVIFLGFADGADGTSGAGGDGWDDGHAGHGGHGGHGGEGVRAAYLGVVQDRADGDADAGWQTLRAAGGRLSELDASLAATLLALANWHRTHGRCSRCGAPTVPVSAGWVRRCTVDGTEHFPRTDPSVIMSVVDDAGRLLLGRGVTWPENQYSVLAGFVEPGESLEAAVIREVREEAGVEVTDVRYLGSQPWPFPSSLMLGFTARAVTTGLTHDPAEMAEVRWVSREEYAALLRSGTIRVPGAISIARRLIERWLGQDVESAAGGPVVEGWRPGVS